MHRFCASVVFYFGQVSFPQAASRSRVPSQPPLVRLNSQTSHIHFPNLPADLSAPLPAGRYLPETWVTRIVCSFPYGITWASYKDMNASLFLLEIPPLLPS